MPSSPVLFLQLHHDDQGPLMMFPFLVVLLASSGQLAAAPTDDDELAEGEILDLTDDDDDGAKAEKKIDDLGEGEVLDLFAEDDEEDGGAAVDDETTGEDGKESGAQGPGAEEEALPAWEQMEADLRAFLDGNWLDPPGEFWAVRRGGRIEISFFLGAEAAAAKIQPGDISVVPDVGGVVLSPVARWYPVDQVAVVAGLRGYLGIQPAAGTEALTVLTPYFGVRYDLVKEQRLSILIDVYSGPAAFGFASLAEAQPTQGFLDRIVSQGALGAELGGGLVGRYSLGPTTFELRGTVGGRAGSASDLGRPSGEVGPFSAFYAALDLGITWSFWADGLVQIKAPIADDD